MTHWYVVRTHYTQEERAQRNLQQQDYRTLLPLARTESRKANGLLVARIRPLFGSYLFVEVQEDQRWQPVCSTLGVAGFVGYRAGASQPPRVRLGDMDELRGRIASVGGMFQLGLTRPQDILPGMLVRILFGPLRDCNALVQVDHGSRVEVLLEAAGVFSHSHLKLPKECLTAA